MPGKNRYDLPLDFTRYSLTVVNPGKRTALSQGKQTFGKNRITFTNNSDLPGISLALGYYTKKYTRVKNIDIEVYHFQGHDFFSRYFPTFNASIIENVLDNLPKIQPSTPYPHEKLALAETPLQFHSHHREWQDHNEYCQPEILFLSERGNPLNLDFSSTFNNHKRSKNMLLSAEEACMLDLINGLFGSTSRSRTISTFTRIMLPIRALFINKDQKREYHRITNHNITPMYSSMVNYVHSPGIPVMDLVIKSIHEARINESKLNTLSSGLYDSRHTRVKKYLSGNSLRQALSDSTLPVPVKKSILSLKTETLTSYILSLTSNNDYNRFIRGFFKQHQNEATNIQVFLDELEAVTGVRLREYLDKWYNGTGLPAHEITDIKYMILENPRFPGEYMFSCKIHNKSTVDGYVTFSPLSLSYLIPAGTFNEIRFKTNGKTSSPSFQLSTGISKNTPGSYLFSPPRPLKETCPDEKEGIFPTDPAAFMADTGVIIVDDLDEGFKLIHPKKRYNLAKLFKHRGQETDAWTVPSERPNEAEWRKQYDTRNQGNIVRSSHVKLAGEGNFKAEWTADIPREGRYKIYCHLPIPPRDQESIFEKTGWSSGIFTSLKNSKNYFTVFYDNKKEEIIVEQDIRSNTSGWTPLGTFHLTAGKCKVTLDDRGVPGQTIYADAIKWEPADK